MTNCESKTSVLFDLDGTLLDTANDLGEALNYVLTQYGLPCVAREIYRPVASDGALGMLTLGFKEKLKEFDYDLLREKFLSYYQENIAVHTCLYSGVTTLLEYLNQKNIPWGIVTNKPEGLTNLLLPHFDDFSRCKVVIGGDTLAQRKPHPAPLLHACEQMKVSAKECLYIGDALRDIEAGNSANMTTIIAEWGYIKDSDNSQDWQAHYSCKNPEDIISFL